MKIAISGKGGVGKTATSVNMAFMAAHGGYRTLLIDLDPQGASSFYFRVKPSKKQRGKRLINASQSLIKHIKASDYEENCHWEKSVLQGHEH